MGKGRRSKMTVNLTKKGKTSQAVAFEGEQAFVSQRFETDDDER